MSEELSPPQDEVKNIPLPSELPKSTDLSSLPSHILRSSAVESLITQNDDLMARLSVSLRRISILEEKINSDGRNNEKLKFYFENLKDQILVLKERGKYSKERNQALEEEHKKVKEDCKILKIRSEELLLAHKKEKQKLMEFKEQASKRLDRYIRYRGKINTAQRERKEQIKALEVDKREVLVKLAEEQVIKNDFRRKLEEQRKKELKQDQFAKENIRNLVEDHEKKLSSLQKKMVKKEEEIHLLKEKSKDFEKVYNQNVDLQNEIVFTKRKKEELVVQLNSKIEDQKKDLKYYRVEFKKYKLESESLKSSLLETESSFKENEEENKRLQSQIENLQILWKEGQNKIETEEEKSKSLQKLNQTLSLNLSECRKKLQDLKEKTQMKF